MAPNRHYKCRKQDRGSGNQDKQLGDRVSLNRSTSLKDHGARGMGEYAYGAEPDSYTISSLHSVWTPLQCCARRTAARAAISALAKRSAVTGDVCRINDGRIYNFLDS